MTADIGGIWEGTLATETAPAYQAYGGRREIRQLGGQPAAALYDVKLTITSQDEYRKFGTDRFVTEPLVSTISGQLQFRSRIFDSRQRLRRRHRLGQIDFLSLQFVG